MEGYVYRRVTKSDIDSLAQLISAVEAADEGMHRPADEIRAELETAIAELCRAGWLARIDRGQVAGYNYVELVGGAELNFWLRGAVHPGWRGQGIGCRLVQHSWADMRRHCAQTGGKTAWVNAWAYEHDRPRGRLLSRFGLRPYHVYHELEMPAPHIASILTPPGIVIRPWDNRYCEAAVALRNRAFAQNWGYQPTSAETLRRRFETARYEPSFSFTAWRQTPGAGEEMVGLIHACLGWTRKLRQANEGEVVWVAVAAEMRGQGIGRALMLTAMKALSEAGAETLSVSADNYADQPAIGLYTQLGFTIRKAIVDYQGEL